MKWLRGVIAAAVLMMTAVPMVAQDNIGFDGTYWGSRGPYYGWVGGTGVPFLAPGAYTAIDMYCVDAHNYVRYGDTWRANFTKMSDEVGINANTRFGMNQSPWVYGFSVGDFSVQDRYLQAAWLATQMTQANRYEVHSAIWNLFTVGPQDGDWAGWIGKAEQNYTSLNASNWYVVTDVNTRALVDNGVSKQEYIINVVPEPATLILMGTGLVAVMGMTVVMRQSVG